MAHDHTFASDMSERRLWWAVGANVLLTAGQIVGGIVSGSLSLVADALHNLSDAASLFVALIAIRVGKRPPDELKTFGYKRAETIAALVNLTTLVLIGLYLCFEAVGRFITPEPVTGWIVVWVAGLALLVDVFTAFLTFKSSKGSKNIRAVFLHNLSDAMASVGVMLTGVLILQFGWVWTDAVMTLIIAVYILWQGFSELPKVIHILMDGTPEGIEISRVLQCMQSVEGVVSAYHVHVWAISEVENALEAHIVVAPASDSEQVKKSVKAALEKEFGIAHSTIEID